MSPIPFRAALEAFGGWLGLLAFYFVGLVFPIFYALRTFQANQEQHFKRQGRELRAASLVVLLGAALCFVFTSELYLQRHAAEDSHVYARVVDWTSAYTVTYILAPAVGMVRLRRTVKADREWLSVMLPDSRLVEGSTGECRRMVLTMQANSFAEQTWQLLFTIWFMNLTGGLLTVCLGHIVQHQICWWHFPLYNIGGHVALLHAVVGLLDTFFYPFRADSMKLALQCETSDARETHWTAVMEAMKSTRDLLRIIFLGRGPQPPTDLEQAGRSGQRFENEVLASIGQNTRSRRLVDDEKGTTDTRAADARGRQELVAWDERHIRGLHEFDTTPLRQI